MKDEEEDEDQSKQGYIQTDINGEEDKQGQCLRPDDTSGLLVEPVMLWQCSSRESSEPFDAGMWNGIGGRTGLLWIWNHQEWESGLIKQMARFTEYSVVGRKLPTEADQNPKL